MLCLFGSRFEHPQYALFAVNLDEMTINQLKAELEAREESKTGRKPELALIVDARMREPRTRRRASWLEMRVERRRGGVGRRGLRGRDGWSDREKRACRVVSCRCCVGGKPRARDESPCPHNVPRQT